MRSALSVAAALVVAIGSFLSSPSTVQAVQWTSTTATDTGIDAFAPSIAYDSSGRLHLVYIRPYGESRGLYYGTNASGTWQSVKIAGLSSIGNEAWTSLAVDHLGKAHVTYQKLNAGIYYITNLSGSWTRKLIRSSGSFQVYPEIEVDALRKVHLVYFVPSPTSPGLRYSTNRGGRWQTTRITKSAFDLRADLALDTGRKVHVVVRRNSFAYRYLTNKSGVWQGERIRDGLSSTAQPSIVLDASGRPRVAYSTWNMQIPYVRGTWESVRTPSGWQATQLSEYFSSANLIRVAPNGTFHVGAFGTSHYSNESGTWHPTAVGSNVASGPQLKVAFDIGPGGVLAFAYARADGSIGLSTRGAWDGVHPTSTTGP